MNLEVGKRYRARYNPDYVADCINKVGDYFILIEVVSENQMDRGKRPSCTASKNPEMWEEVRKPRDLYVFDIDGGDGWTYEKPIDMNGVTHYREVIDED